MYPITVEVVADGGEPSGRYIGEDGVVSSSAEAKRFLSEAAAMAAAKAILPPSAEVWTWHMLQEGPNT